jgi:3-(3-hydroxy-phenyl)propionate hydroxylase
VLQNTMAQVALARTDERSRALLDVVTDLVGMDEPHRHLAAMLSGLDIRYDLGAEHPLVGRRVPDLDLSTATGPTSVFALLHDARPVLLNFCAPGVDLGSWQGRIRSVHAEHSGTWELPVLGLVPPTAAVAIRPDGHVAWAGDATDPALPAILTTWFGPAEPL